MIFHSIHDIRKKLLEDDKKRESKQTDVYPFWNIPENKPCVIRFLPDGNPENIFFWVERQMIQLPFPGTESNPSKPIVISVPCVEMYGQNRYCPVMQELRKMFKDNSMTEIARKYWKKRTYLFQGFVVEDPLMMEGKADDLLENPIKKFIINPSIFKIIQSSILDTEIEESPVHYELGRDFRLIRTKKGQFSDYSVSKWSMKTRPLSEFELEAIEKYGLYDLSSLLPKEPTEKELNIIYEMFKASVNEELCKDEWRRLYYGREVNNDEEFETNNLKWSDDLNSVLSSKKEQNTKVNENVSKVKDENVLMTKNKTVKDLDNEDEDDDYNYDSDDEGDNEEVVEKVNNKVEEDNDILKKKTDPKSILERLKQRNKK